MKLKVFSSKYVTKLIQYMKIRMNFLIKPNSILMDGQRYSSDSSIPPQIRQNLYRYSYENVERRYVKELVRNDDFVVDIGGCLGIISSLIASIVGSEKVVVFEPNPVAVKILKKNLRINNHNHTTVIEKAVSSNSGFVDMHVSDTRLLSSAISDNGFGLEKMKVETVNLEQLIEQYSPTVLIIDIEGEEVNLLPSSTFSNVRLVIVETHERFTGEESTNLIDVHMKENGFDISGRGNVRVYQRS